MGIAVSTPEQCKDCTHFSFIKANYKTPRTNGCTKFGTSCEEAIEKCPLAIRFAEVYSQLDECEQFNLIFKPRLPTEFWR